MPSRRTVLASFGAGLALGVTGGYVGGAAPFASDDSGPSAPLVAGPTEWPFANYDRGHTRNPPAESAPADDRQERWRFHFPVIGDTGQPVVGNGQVLLPDVAESRREKGTMADPVLRSLDLRTGEQRWEWSTSGMWYSKTVATVGNSVFCTADVESRGSTVLSLAASNGVKQWGADGFLRAPLITAAGNVLTLGADHDLQAVDAQTGSTQWMTDEMVARVPAYDGTNLVLEMEDRLLSLDPQTGAERWRKSKPGSPIWGPVLAAGRLFLGTTHGELVAYDAASGERRWYKNPTNSVKCREDKTCARWFSTGAVSAETLVVVENRVDDEPDVLHVRNPATGSLRWTAEPSIGSDGHFRPPVFVDGKVYVGAFESEQQIGAIEVFDVQSGTRLSVSRFDAPILDLAVTDGWVLAQSSEWLAGIR